MASWTEDMESEDIGDAVWESEDFGEGDGEGSDDSEASRWETDRRARARRLAAARRRAYRYPPAGRTTVVRPVSPRDTVTAIRELDLQTKVGNDSLRAMLERANRRARRANYVVPASLAVDQVIDTFGDDLADHAFVRAGLRSLPLLLLSPERTKRGFEGFILDPRVLGFAGVVAIVGAGQFRSRGVGVTRIEILNNAVTGSGTLRGIATDKNGRDLGETLTFRSMDAGILDVRPDGTFTVNAKGRAFVTATAGGYSHTFVVTTT
jgi:hypothetical protein